MSKIVVHDGNENKHVESLPVKYDAPHDVIVDNATNGLVLRDADGHYWRVSVSLLGVLISTDLGTTKP